MSLDLDAIREKLGIGYDEGAAWFHFVTAPYGFDGSHPTKPRPVVLARWQRYKCLAFPRSLTSKDGREHDAHDHVPSDPHCRVNEPGKIVTTFRMLVPASQFNALTYTCAEPDPAVTADVLKAANG